MIFQEMIGHVLQMRNKILEFSFYPEGSNEGRKTTFLFFCKVCHLNYIYIFRSRQLILQDMIGHVLQMRNKVSEFSFYPEGSNEGGKTTFLFFFCKVCHLNYIYIFRRRQLILQHMIGHVQQMCSKDSEFSFYPLGSYEGGKMTFYVTCHLNSI